MGVLQRSARSVHQILLIPYLAEPQAYCHLRGRGANMYCLNITGVWILVPSSFGCGPVGTLLNSSVLQCLHFLK